MNEEKPALQRAIEAVQGLDPEDISAVIKTIRSKAASRDFVPEDALEDALLRVLPDYWKADVLAQDLLTTLRENGWELERKWA